MQTMKNTTDLRIQRTELSLRKALLELLSEKNFENITVGEICERAMVRRATFYSHYGSKYDLFVSVIRSLRDDFEEKYFAAEHAGGSREYYMVMIDCALQTLEENRSLVQTILKSGSGELLFQMMSQEIEKNILRKIRQDCDDGMELNAPPELTAAMLTGALTYTLRWWTQQDPTMSRTELAEAFRRVVISM